jgi:ribosome-binding factor A
MPRQAFHKNRQLCAQVREALYWVLGSEVGDEKLSLLQVLAVDPAPDASHLLVTLAGPSESVGDLTGRLRQASKAIRGEVAASIHRRKAPELTFHVLPTMS